MATLHIKSILSFGVILGAALSGGRFASKMKLPAISGFLLTGLLSGPALLGFLGQSELSLLQPLDHWALAFIAFTAGFELDLKVIKQRLAPILGVMMGLICVTFTLSAAGLFALSELIPALAAQSVVVKLSASMLLGVIMVARSPSAAIAIINELKASGPYTQLALGVTVLMDVVVVALFAMVSLLAQALITGAELSASVMGSVGAELLCSGGLGLALAALLRVCTLAQNTHLRGLTLLLGVGSIPLLAELSEHTLHFEPLLTCLVAGATLRMWRGEEHEELERDLGHYAPWVYLTFFTLTGASLELEQLLVVWPIALLCFATRLVGLKLGATLGAWAVGEPRERRGFYWMGFVTQAGVGLGLAKQVAHDFPEWGPSLATLVISVIVMNELVGPLFFKRAISLSGEASSDRSIS